MENNFLDTLLSYLNISSEQYEELIKPQTLDTFSLGHSFKGIEKAKDIVNNAIKNKKRILIYGDFDADGIMATSIMVKMFKKLNYEVSYYIPSRYIDGYGLTIEKAEKCINKFDLVIPVDNGIVANEAIDILKKNNIEVVVIDHHEPQLPLPNADAIVHPFVSNYGEITTSAGFCAFMFSKEILGYYDKYLATLAAISVVSDMMPLKEYNRNLLRAVFSDYKYGEFPQITFLAESPTFDEIVIGQTIAPKINSVGRIKEDKSVNLLVKYFVSDDSNEILTYSDYFNNVNIERKELSKKYSEDLLKQLGNDSLVFILEVKTGMAGIIANNLVTRLKKPIIVFAKIDDKTLKGSARSVEGFNIVEAFNELDKYIIQAGGHALAGGCEILVKDFENFKKDFEKLVNSKEIIIPEDKSIKFSINNINKEYHDIYRSLSPFGTGWEAPNLKIEKIKTSSLTYSKTNEHILKQIGYSSKIVGFNISKNSLKDISYIDIYGTLSSSTYKGNRTYQFNINKYKSSN